MSEFLNKLSGGELVGMVAVVGIFSCGIVAIVMGSWVKLRRTEIGAALKQDMLNRGMSAEEIRSVLDAGEKHFGKSCGRTQSSRC